MAGIALPFKTFNFGIPYGEKPPYTEKSDRERTTSKRTLICNWTDVLQFRTAILGTVSRNQNQPGTFNRLLPQPHPYATQQMFAVECELVNANGAFTFDPNDGLIFFSDKANGLDGVAEWSVSYEQLDYDIQTDQQIIGVVNQQVNKGGAQPGDELKRFVSRDPSEDNLEVYQLPGTSHVWGTPSPGPLGTPNFNWPVPEPVPYQRPVQILKYTWHWVPEPIPVAISNVAGHLNQAAFDGVNGNEIYPPSSLFCMPIRKSKRIWTPDGVPCRNLHFTFAYRPDSGWNRFYRAALGDFDFIKTFNPQTQQIGGIAPYTPADFTVLFTA